MSDTYSADGLYFPVVLASGENQIRYTDTTGTYDTTITAGTYYTHRNTTLNGAGWPSLWIALEAAMLADSGGTYVWAAATPAEAPTLPYSGDQTNRGIEVTRSGGTSITLHFNHANWTMRKDVFGMTTDASLDEDITDPVTTGTATMPLTMFGRWTSWNIWTSRAARRKTHTRHKLLRASDEDDFNAYQLKWRERRRRRLVYEEVPAAHIWGDRANNVGYAASAALARYDVHNGFVDLWEQASELKDIIAVYNLVSDLNVTNHDYEILRLRERDRGDFEPNLTREAPESYKIDVEFVVHPTYQSYDH